MCACSLSNGEHVGDDVAIALADVLRGSSSLRELDLTKCDISAAGGRALATSIGGLRKLVLSNNWALKDEGAIALAEALSGKARLKVLDLRACGIGAAGGRALAASLRVLERIFLGGNRLMDEGVCALAEGLRDNTRLKELDLYDCLVGASGGRALAASLETNATLTKLDLYGSGLAHEVREALRAVAAGRATLEITSDLNNPL